MTHRNAVRVWPAPGNEPERAALDWLQFVDVVFSTDRQDVTLRVHTRDGWQEVRVFRARAVTQDVTSWCQTCRRAVESWQGQWRHKGVPLSPHTATPAPLAGRILMEVPHEGTALSVMTDGTLARQAPVLPLARPGLLLIGDI
jgi:hypothetical protein